MSADTTSARLPTAAGEFQLHLFGGEGGKGHLALVHGEVAGQAELLVRVHSECFTGEALGSLRCDCGPQLTDALRQIASEGSGVLVYLRQEGRGIGLREKLRAYNLQDAGHDTVDANLMLGHPADDREYSAAAEILHRLGVASVRLLTNNPAKIEGLRRHGITVAERVPTLLHVNSENAPYLVAKARRMRHVLDLGLAGVEPANGGGGNGARGRAAAHQADASSRAGESGGEASGSAVAAAVAVTGAVPALAEVAAPAPGLEALRRRLASHRQSGARRPFVTLSYAQSVDGCIAATADRPLALSGQASLTLTHAVRALHDAILVGVGTVVADDPRLTVRLVAGAQPRPVVVDGTLRTPPVASLLQGAVPPLVATTAAADPARQRRLEAAGAEVVRLPADSAGQVSLPALLDHLGTIGVSSLMVEGGARIITSFLGSRLVDHLVLTVAPLLVGGLRGVHELGAASIPRLRNVVYQPLGDDLVMWADPLWEPG